MSGERAARIRRRAQWLERLMTMVQVAARLRPEQEGVCGAGPRPGRRVTVRRGGDRLVYEGLFTCDATRTCPRCARGPLKKQREELETLMADNERLGGDTVMVSLSMSFPEDASLFERWTILRSMLTKLGERTSAKNARKKVGRRSHAKIVHLVHGRHGWHAHVHLLHILDRRITDHEAQALEFAETAVWSKLAKSYGCTALASRQRYEVVGRTATDFHETARYLTKGWDEITYGTETKYKRAFRCARDHGGRSPWQLLHAAAVEGDLLALVPLQEWIEVIDSGRFQSVHMPRKVMRDLREAVEQLPPATDDVQEATAA